MSDDRQSRAFFEQVINRRNTFLDAVVVDDPTGITINGRVDIDTQENAPAGEIAVVN